LSVWIAPRDISPAAEWAEEIIEAISAARIMVLVFSANSNSSPQVRREVERAVHKDLRILPFRIEAVLPSKSLEYFLSAQHWLDGFPAPREPHYCTLCGHLRHWLADEDALPELASPTAAVAPQRLDGGPSPAGRFTAAQLLALQTSLAAVIGPVAKVLVSRAAAAASNLGELERRLAAELDSQDDQRRFLEACQCSRHPPQ
jgi:hypothetical protein